MAATTGVLMALFTTDWSRATNFVPAGKSSMTGFSSSAVVATLAPTLAGLLWTLRTNTSDGLRRSSDADCTDELEGAGAVWIPPVSEKSIFPNAYGPTFLGTGVVEDFGCTPITGCVGRAVLPTSSGVTPWLPGASGCPVCAFSRGVTDPVWSLACWPGVSLRPKSGAPMVVFSFSSAILVLPRGAHPEPNWCQCGAVHSPRLRHLQQKHLVRLLVWRTIKHYDTVGAFGRSQPAPVQPKVQHL